MTAPAYTARASLLKKFAQSAAHARAYIDGGSTDESVSQRLGSGTHALLFRDKPVVVYRGGEYQPPGAKKPKTYTAVRSGECWEAFREQHKGAVILNDKEHAAASAMAASIRSDMDADRLLFAPGTKYEQKIEWEMQGRRCSGTIDAFGPLDGDALVDLKSTKDASPARFGWQARNLGYREQLAFYAAGLEACGYGRRVPYIVAVENSPPYAVQVYRLTVADLDTGRWQVEAWLEQLIRCERTGCWPAYSSGILPLNAGGAPKFEDDEDELEDSTDEVAA